MSLSGTVVGWSNGIVVKTKNVTLCLDPCSPADKYNSILISHAHGDHTPGFRSKKLKYSTNETLKIYEEGGGQAVKNFKPIRYGETLKIDDVEVVAYNAGHMLGSAQFEIRTPEQVVVYTGDINCVETLTTKPADIVNCDVLIIESTYGSPEFIFPERMFVYSELAKWVISQVRSGRIPTFHVYSAGKAQEVIRLLNVFTNVPVVVHQHVGKISDAHRRLGVDLDFVSDGSAEGVKLLAKGGCVYIVPPSIPSRFSRKMVSAMASGWAVKFRPRKFDAVFPVSSHADFKQLVAYVKAVKPRVVYTCFGFESAFSEYLRRRERIDGCPLARIGGRIRSK